MTDPDVDLIGELGRLLDDVRPSPEFAPGIRGRIAVGRGAGVRRFGWRPFTLAGVALSLAAVLVATAVVHRRVPAPEAQTIARTEPPSATAPDSSVATREPEVPPPARVAHATSSNAELAVDDIVTVSRLGGHDVIVPADQRWAMARLLAGVRSGRVMGPAGLTPPYDKNGLLLPLPPVAVTPLPALAPDDPDGDGGRQDSGGPGRDRPRKDK